jgi:transposase-like protein
VVNVHALIAVGINAEGYREILGIDVTTAEDGAGWLTFLRSLTARGLSGVRLVTSDAHAGLLAAIGATLPGASWQRCRTHYAASCSVSRRRRESPFRARSGERPTRSEHRSARAVLIAAARYRSSPGGRGESYP